MSDDQHSTEPRDAFGLTPLNSAGHAHNVEWWRGLTDEKRLTDGERTLLKSIQDWQIACECAQLMKASEAAAKAARTEVDAMAGALSRYRDRVDSLNKALDLLLPMAREYAEAGGRRGIEMMSYNEARELAGRGE